MGSGSPHSQSQLSIPPPVAAHVVFQFRLFPEIRSDDASYGCGFDVKRLELFGQRQAFVFGVRSGTTLVRICMSTVQSSQTNIHLPSYIFGKNIELDIAVHASLPGRHIRVLEGVRNSGNRDAKIMEIRGRQAYAS